MLFVKNIFPRIIHKPMILNTQFLPATRAEMDALGWDAPDFVYVSGDAYVDHPSFGAALICRMLEAQGFRVAMLAQPDFRSCEDFRRYGKPKLGFLVSSGNIDSMVAHYTVAKKKRSYDYYSPGGKAGLRPDRAVIVYCNRIREAYGDVPIVIGGLEASLRRFAHYDYWDDKIRRSILVDSRADLLSYGMGERSISRIAELLRKGVPVKKIRDVRGTAYLCKSGEESEVKFPIGGEFDFNDIKEDKDEYVRAFGVQYKNQDSVSGKALIEHYDNRTLVQNPPAAPLERDELDKLYAIPFARTWHPMYEKDGGVPAIEEVQFSITHNRGCFGACNFCALAFHQGRSVRSRSAASVVDEAKLIASMPNFKGYIHDVGGPTANFRYPACEKQLTEGVCTGRKCLAPKPCPNLKADHGEYAALLRDVAAIPGIKRVFVRSGVRFDYLLADKNNGDLFFKQLVRDHVSGQLKVAPEHISTGVLNVMGKPSADVYDRFAEKFYDMCASCGKEQYLVPYLMSSHPGSTLNDAVELALYLKRHGMNPEQVQDFYPTPGTASTVMYYTGKNPLTGKSVYVCTDYHEKQLQRALLQFGKRENAALIREALEKCGRTDLIGSGKDCLVSDAPNRGGNPKRGEGKSASQKSGKPAGKPAGKSAGKSGGKPAGKPEAKPGSGNKPALKGSGRGKASMQSNAKGRNKAKDNFNSSKPNYKQNKKR